MTTGRAPRSCTTSASSTCRTDRRADRDAAARRGGADVVIVEPPEDHRSASGFGLGPASAASSSTSTAEGRATLDQPRAAAVLVHNPPPREPGALDDNSRKHPDLIAVRCSPGPQPRRRRSPRRGAPMAASALTSSRHHGRCSSLPNGTGPPPISRDRDQLGAARARTGNAGRGAHEPRAGGLSPGDALAARRPVAVAEWGCRRATPWRPSSSARRRVDPLRAGPSSRR
jgi:hypothetical protein